MDDAILVAKFGVRRRGFRLGEKFIHAPLGIGIEHEELAGMCLRVAKELEAVGFGAGKRLFVAEDDTGGIFFELARANKTATSAALFGAGHGVFLGVSVKRGHRILLQSAVAHPVGESSTGTGVDIVLLRISWMVAAFFDGDEVVRFGGVIFFLHGGRNLVVGLGEDAFEGNAGGVVTKGAKGKNLS